MLKINNISFSYGEKQIFRDFSLEICENDRLWLYGESGCGKTTLTRLLLGLEKADSGEIIKDNDFKFSCVFQENRLLPFKTALQNVMLVSDNLSLAKGNLIALGLENDINTPVNQLSGGMKRRVAIARALTAEFDCLILDEAFTGLDEENIKTAIKRILEIAQSKPIILISHSSLEAELLNAQKYEL